MVRPVQAMLGGAQKAGTSSLVQYLGQHPQICTHSQAEFAFFVNDEEYNRGYHQVFPGYFKPCPAEKVVLAKNVGLMYLPEAAQRLHDHAPQVEVVFLLRNPVDRAYSAYWYARRMGWELLESFEVALSAGAERFLGNWVQERNCMYLERSIYAHYIPRFFDLFGPEQVHIFLLEDMKTDPWGVCRRIFQVLGVDPDFVPEVTRRYNMAATARSESLAQLLAHDATSAIKRLLRRFLPTMIRYKLKGTMRRLNEREFSPPPMNLETRRELTAYFKPFNAQLSELLGRDLSHWDA